MESRVSCLGEFYIQGFQEKNISRDPGISRRLVSHRHVLLSVINEPQYSLHSYLPHESVKKVFLNMEFPYTATKYE